MKNVEIMISAFPEENDRPCYRVYEKPIMNNGEQHKEGVYYHGIERKGTGDKEEINLIDEWLSSPLEVIANTIDEKGNAGKLVELSRTDLPIKERIIIPKEAITKSYDPPAFNLLSRRSVNYNDPHKKKLLFFLQKDPFKLAYVKSSTGWSDEGAFILPDETLGADNLMIDIDFNDYTRRGTLDDWKNTIGNYAKGNPIVQLAIMAGFAGTLLKDVNIIGGGFHFFGGTSNGKTTLLRSSASIWGHGVKYATSWSSTGSGLEQFALLRNDTLMALDEMTASTAETIDDTIYGIMNGYTKTRAKGHNGNVSASHRKTWRVMAVSTGEDSIKEFLKTGKGKLQKGGQAVRFLDIPAYTRAYGVFDDLRGFDKPAELAEEIEAASMEYYGTAGRAFVRYLIEHNANIKELHREARTQVTNTPTSNEEDRVIKLFALLCVAGELAIQAGILPWDKNEPLKAVQLGFKLWRKARGVSGVKLSVIHVLNAFREKTLKSPFLFADNSRSADGEHAFNEILGWYVNRGTAGTEAELDREYIFLKDSINRLTNGRVTNDETAEAFYSIQALIHDENRKTTKRTVKGLGRVRVYVVEAQKVYTYLEEQESELEEEEERVN